MLQVMYAYEVRPRKDKRGDLISDALPFGRLWYGEPNAVAKAVSYAQHFSRSHHAVIRVYDAAGNVIERTSTRAISRSREFARITPHLALTKFPRNQVKLLTQRPRLRSHWPVLLASWSFFAANQSTMVARG